MQHVLDKHVTSQSHFTLQYLTKEHSLKKLFKFVHQKTMHNM